MGLERDVLVSPSQEVPMVGQPPRGGADLALTLDRLPQIAPHRIPRHADGAGNRSAAYAAIRQRANREDDLTFDHWNLPRRRSQHIPLELHSTLLQRGSELVSRGGQYHCLH